MAGETRCDDLYVEEEAFRKRAEEQQQDVRKEAMGKKQLDLLPKYKNEQEGSASTTSVRILRDTIQHTNLTQSIGVSEAEIGR